VREAFVRLFERGLIYPRASRDPLVSRCLTSLSDEEAESKETPVPVSRVVSHRGRPTQSITVATTRPETMLATSPSRESER